MVLKKPGGRRNRYRQVAINVVLTGEDAPAIRFEGHQTLSTGALSAAN